MPDKKKTDHPTDDQPPTRKRSPKAPAQDYSSLPQKPIKLKADVDLPPALKRSGSKSSAKKRTTPPTVKKKSTGKSRAKRELPLSGLSEQARDLAAAAAENEGLSISDWVEKAIIERSQTPSAGSPSDLEAMRLALQQINERLWHLESRKGFWRRFWEQYVEPYQK